MGTPQFAVGILDALLTSEIELVAVVTQPDKKVGRKQEVQATPVKIEALKHQIPVFQPEKIGSLGDEIKALDNLDSKNVAVIDQNFKLPIGLKMLPIKNMSFQKDSTATIQLSTYKPNHLKYISKNSNEGFAVFSENYYKNGWKATIDGKETPIFRTNYVLRGIKVPAGKHTIEFKFEPQVVKTGSTIALSSKEKSACGA